MTNRLISDLKGVLRAFDSVLRESFKYQQDSLGRMWNNSSMKMAIEEKSKRCRSDIKNISQEDIAHALKESCERASMVAHSLKVYVTTLNSPNEDKIKLKKVESKAEQVHPVDKQIPLPKGVCPEDLEVSELHQRDKELIKKLEKEFDQKLKEEKKREARFRQLEIQMEKQNSIDSHNVEVEKSNREKSDEKSKPKIQPPTVKKFVPKKQELNPEAKQRKVPSTRLGRMISFGSLAAGLGVGAVAEVTRRSLGFTSDDEEKNPRLDQLFLTEANAERIVNTLCKVRGAALKIGQIFSIQDNTVISPVLQKAFERVRQSADFMPTWQVHKVLVNEFGPDWREKLSHFEEKPFAAASIGQVHYVRLKNGMECAMKIQYPGVAQGIESDINNLVSIMKIWNVFPKGLFIDNLVEVAKRELAWEVDYLREAECTKKFKELLSPYPDYVVPDVIDELSTGQVFTTTLIEGVPVDQCTDFDENHRERIAKLIMQLCLREVFEFRYMQTDPNWSNFFYEPDTGKVLLLDFGASRSYEYEFVRKYIEVIKAAADGDKEKVFEISKEMGFLTGYESKKMRDAHVDAVMILAEVFSSGEAFDFGHQDTTLRIQKLVPTIVAERLCPPPEEIYSLHRKLSGVFLLCAKLRVKISCREMFLEVYEKFKEDLNTRKAHPSSPPLSSTAP